MSIVTIEAAEQVATPGDLNAHVTDGKLLLPREVAHAFRRQGVRTAQELVAYLQAFPSGAAETLHWSVQDVGLATTRLTRELLGHVSGDILGPPARANPPFGARDPKTLR